MNKKRIFLVAVFLAVCAQSQVFALPTPVSMRLALPSTEFAPGKSYPILLEVTIKDGFHINSQKPDDPSLIPTKAFFTADDESVAFGRITYPTAKLKKFKFSMQKMSIYDGKIYMATSISLADEIEGTSTINARLEYQACTDEACLMPDEIIATAVLKIGAGGVALEEKLFDENASGMFAGTANGGISSSGIFENFSGKIGLTALMLVFIGGLALNLTPCVYPMIPLTVGYFGAATGRSRREIVTHAFVYLLGLALTYSVLGTIAALTGSLFGQLMQNTFVIIILVAVIVMLSLSMFGAYNIPVPSLLLKTSSRSYSGYFGTLFMGLTVGIVAAPCVGPFVVGLLAFVGERQDPLLGFTLFFILALGLGTPFVVLAFFSSRLGSLPRAGRWMVWVKKLFGLALLGMALYFAQPLLSAKMFGGVALAMALGGGAYLIIAGAKIGGAVFNFLRYGISLLIVALGVWIFSVTGAVKEGIPFKEYSESAFEQAVRDEKPIILDFTADWCVPCKELDMFTFSDEEVIRRAARFEALRVDLTRITDEELKTKKKFNVYGVPTVILFDSRGKEQERFTGFITAEEFLAILEVANNRRTR